jgi:hypothetical protein
MSEENYPVISAIEQSITKQVNALIGKNDVNLNTLYKLAIMKEINQISEDEEREILQRIKASNKVEDFYINQEYELTYDKSGNLIFENNKNENTSLPEQ